MLKKIITLSLVSLFGICALAHPVFASDEEKGVFSDTDGIVHMRSVKTEDNDNFTALTNILKTDATNPTGGASLIKTAVDRRVSKENPYHMMRFSLSADDTAPIAFIAQGRMPVFGFAAGKSYDPVEHAAIIEKWKSLGVRKTVGDHDERVDNLGLLNWVPYIHPEIDEGARLEIYTKILNRAKTLRAEDALMNAENNHLLECTDHALPQHILLLVHPGFRDIALLQSIGFELDANPEFEKFYNAPRVILTYNLAS